MVAIGDLNGDGKLDLVLANNSQASVSVLLNNGNESQRLLNHGQGTATDARHRLAVGDNDVVHSSVVVEGMPNIDKFDFTW